MTSSRRRVRSSSGPGRGRSSGRDWSRSPCSTTPSRRPAGVATPCCSPGRSTTASICCRRTRTRRRRCVPRCRSSARASASTRSGRQRSWRGSWTPPTRLVTCRWCVGSPPRARSGGAGPARSTCGSRACTSRSPLEEGRIDDATEAHLEFQMTCPTHKRQQFQRLEIALAAARGDRAAGERLFEGLLQLPKLTDNAITLNVTVALVEDLLTLGVAPADIRDADVRRLARRPPIPRRHPGPRRGAAGAGRGRRRERRRRRSARCWRALIRASPSR